MTAAPDITFSIVDAGSPEARAAMAEYFAELDRRLPGGFRPDAALDDAATSLNPPAGLFLVGRSNTEVVACGGVRWLDETTAEVKRMWVDARARGLGLGRRTLGALEEQAWRSGRTRVVLDTNMALVEAITMYRSTGYRDIPPYNDNPDAHHWFEKVLGAQGGASW